MYQTRINALIRETKHKSDIKHREYIKKKETMGVTALKRPVGKRYREFKPV